MKLGTRIAAWSALGLIASFGAVQAAPRTFVVDRTHSEVGFNIRHFFNKTHGRFENYDGTIVFDDSNLPASTVALTIQDSSIYTANDRRDQHLRTQDFFWTEKYPTITFKSTKVVPGKTKEHFQVLGDLTIRDVTKPVTLEVDYLGQGPVSMGGHEMGTQAGFSASTTINRKDFGIIWNKQLDSGSVMLGDDVDIVLSVAAIDAASRKPPTEAAAAKKPDAAGEKKAETADKK